MDGTGIKTMPQIDTKRRYSTSIVFELIDLSEYALLIPMKREVIRMILSLDYIDLTEGNKTLAILDDYFPVDTITRFNINELIFDLPKE